MPDTDPNVDNNSSDSKVERYTDRYKYSPVIDRIILLKPKNPALQSRDDDTQCLEKKTVHART